jgi:hypothetical protein
MRLNSNTGNEKMEQCLKNFEICFNLEDDIQSTQII